MVFVPLPLFATLLLLIMLVMLLRQIDLTVRANQLFSVLVALYAMQSLAVVLRWGYLIDGFADVTALLAPLLPACAYRAYRALFGRLGPRNLWPLAVVALVWAAWVMTPAMVDPALIFTYAGFGIALLLMAGQGDDALPHLRIGDGLDARRAMQATGILLIASACVDVFVVVDFIRTGGENIGLIVSVIQSASLIGVGVAAVIVSGQGRIGPEAPRVAMPAIEPDEGEIAKTMARLDRLMTDDELYRDTDLNLRRLSRRLGVPDRAVSQAVNRCRGVSVSQYVNELRVAAACAEMRDGTQSILQASMAAGFLSKSNFNREFVRVMGQTPSAWRRVVAEIA